MADFHRKKIGGIYNNSLTLSWCCLQVRVGLKIKIIKIKIEIISIKNKDSTKKYHPSDSITVTVTEFDVLNLSGVNHLLKNINQGSCNVVRLIQFSFSSRTEPDESSHQ